MRKWLYLVFFIILGLSGCTMQDGLEDLPKQPEAEVSHNTKSLLEGEENPVQKPEMDPDFVNQYAERFHQGQKEILSGIDQTKEDFSHTDQDIMRMQKKVQEDYDKASDTEMEQETAKVWEGGKSSASNAGLPRMQDRRKTEIATEGREN